METLKQRAGHEVLRRKLTLGSSMPQVFDDDAVRSKSPDLQLVKMKTSVDEQITKRYRIYESQIYGPLKHIALCLTFYVTPLQSSVQFDRPKLESIHQQLEQLEFSNGINLAQNERKFKLKVMMQDMLSSKLKKEFL